MVKPITSVTALTDEETVEYHELKAILVNLGFLEYQNQPELLMNNKIYDRYWALRLKVMQWNHVNAL